MGMPDSLHQLLDYVVRQGSQKADAPVLPHWITDGAELQYVSQSSGEAHDVIVEHISHSKRQVRFVFASDRKTWKAATFEQIVAGRNPLRRRPEKKSAQKPVTKDAKDGDAAKDDEGDDFDALIDNLEGKWSEAEAAKKKRQQGPSALKQPHTWQRPDIVDVDHPPNRGPAINIDLDQSIDLDPELPPPVKDPYGLEAAVAEGRLKLPETMPEKRGRDQERDSKQTRKEWRTAKEKGKSKDMHGESKRDRRPRSRSTEDSDSGGGGRRRRVERKTSRSRSMRRKDKSRSRSRGRREERTLRNRQR